MRNPWSNVLGLRLESLSLENCSMETNMLVRLSNFIDYCELFKCCSEDYSLEMDKFYCIIIDMPSTTFSTIQFTSKDGEYFVKVCASATKYVYLRSDADDKISASTASAFADALSKEDTMRALTINCRDVKIFATLKDAYTIQ